MELLERCDEMLAWCSQQQHLELKQQEEERMDLLEKLIMFLPPMRQQIMGLHYLKGIAAHRIAAHMQITETQVADEIRQALDFLTKVTEALAQKPAPLRLPMQASAKSNTCKNKQAESEKIFRMRHQDKYSFSLIATKMRHSPVYIHQAFIEMHAWLHRLRQTG